MTNTLEQIYVLCATVYLAGIFSRIHDWVQYRGHCLLFVAIVCIIVGFRLFYFGLFAWHSDLPGWGVGVGEGLSLISLAVFLTWHSLTIIWP